MDNKFVLSQSFNDIVFENRNKQYGAYEIRRKYTRYMVLAGAAAVLFVTCGTFTWAYVQNPEDKPRVVVTTVELPIVENITKKDEEVIKPKFEPIPQPPAGGQTATAITAQIDIVPEDSAVPPGNIVVDIGPTGPTGPQGPGGPGDCLDCPKVDTTTPAPIKIVDWSMYPPECPGLDAHITKNVRYPDLCREMGIEGTVYVEFIVDTKGSYRDVKVVKGPHPALNKEALRVMNFMPTWTPAKDEHGNLVDYIMRKPIRFSLNK